VTDLVQVQLPALPGFEIRLTREQATALIQQLSDAVDGFDLADRIARSAEANRRRRDWQDRVAIGTQCPEWCPDPAHRKQDRQ
jgi:hypothetical protein